MSLSLWNFQVLKLKMERTKRPHNGTRQSIPTIGFTKEILSTSSKSSPLGTDILSKPLHAFVQSLPCQCATRLNVPGVPLDRCQVELL
jgi:hypothetical protein